MDNDIPISDRDNIVQCLSEASSVWCAAIADVEHAGSLWT